MGNKWRFIILLALLLIMLAIPAKASAHGAHIQYTSSTIEITAKYDNGEPMAGAQVTIYAPDDLSNAWQTGTLDDEGHFTFTPDTSKPGNWKVKVRLGGHGEANRHGRSDRRSRAAAAVVGLRRAPRTRAECDRGGFPLGRSATDRAPARRRVRAVP